MFFIRAVFLHLILVRHKMVAQEKTVAFYIIPLVSSLRFSKCLCLPLPPSTFLPLSLPQVSNALALSCVLKVIAHGSQGVCVRACHKQSSGMSGGLVHEPNPVSEAE